MTDLDQARKSMIETLTGLVSDPTAAETVVAWLEDADDWILVWDRPGWFGGGCPLCGG